MQDGSRKVRVVELERSEVDYSEPIDRVDTHLVPRRFLEWQLDGDFDYALLVPEHRGWLDRIRGVPVDLPSVCLGSEDGRARQSELEQYAIAGFSLLIVTRSTEQACREFFAGHGYKISDDAQETSEPLRAICPPWNSVGLTSSLALASRIGWTVACGFGHDAEWIYLLTAEG